MTVYTDVIMGGEVTDRVQSGIRKMQDALKGKSRTQLDQTGRALDITSAEHRVFHNVQAAAHAGGIVSFEEAQSLYQYLGDSHRVFNAQEAAVKLVVTKIITVLMQELGMA